MWIKIRQKGIKFLINSSNLSSILLDEELEKIQLQGINLGINFYFGDFYEMEAFYQGFELALNGLDFEMGEDYIKPLIVSKDKIAYEHIRLLEILGERKS